MRILRRVPMLAMLVVLCGSASTVAEAGADVQDRTDQLATLRRAEASYDLGIELLETRPEEARAAFAVAAADFASVIDQGVRNAGLHYNLGNALLRSGDRGGAILELLRASALDPADPSIASNLAFARSQVPGRPTTGDDPSIADRLATWWHVVPLRMRAASALALWVLFWILLAVRQGRTITAAGRGRNLWPATLGILLVASVVLGTTAAIDLRTQRVSDRAVVVAEEAVLRKGNGDGFEAELVQPLVSGIECRVLEARPGWTRVALDDGRSGWLPEASLRTVADSTG
jgi:hypothetical protein